MRIIIFVIFFFYILFQSTAAADDAVSNDLVNFKLNEFSDLKIINFSDTIDSEPEIVQVNLYPPRKLETYICGYSQPAIYEPQSSYEEESEEYSDSDSFNQDTYCRLLK